MRKVLVSTGVVAACAVCCAPLIGPLVVPLLAGTGLAGTVAAWRGSALPADAWVCGGITLALLAGVAGWAWVRWRRAAARRAACACPQACSTDGCAPRPAASGPT